MRISLSSALLVVFSHAFIPWRAPPLMPRMPQQQLLSESNEEQLRDQLEEASTTLTTEQATRLAAIEERDGGSLRDEEAMSALTTELGYVPLVGSRVLELLDAAGARPRPASAAAAFSVTWPLRQRRVGDGASAAASVPFLSRSSSAPYRKLVPARPAKGVSYCIFEFFFFLNFFFFPIFFDF